MHRLVDIINLYIIIGTVQFCKKTASYLNIFFKFNLATQLLSFQ